MLSNILILLIPQPGIFTQKSYPSVFTVLIKVLMFESISTIYQNQIIE